MRYTTALFLLMTLLGLLLGHPGAALLSLLWAGVCWYAMSVPTVTVKGCGVKNTESPEETEGDTVDTETLAM